MFQVGGTDVYVHKYMGASTANGNATADQPNYSNTSVTNIQDLLFLENRDRKYDKEIYRIRGLYNVQNIDFNLSQFGLFIDNDTLFMTIHINDIIKTLGRKPISGDVIELPHLRDDFALNDFDVSLPRYYVIEDVGRASEGFSVTWYPHLYRLKLKRVTDNQQFSDIFNQQAVDSNGDPISTKTDGTATTLKDLLSTYNQELQINDAVVTQAEIDAPKSGYETRQFYTLAVDPTNGKPLLVTADETDLDASLANNIRAGEVNAIPKRTGYSGYLVGDGFPVNGYDFGFGVTFPSNPQDNDFYLRADFFPNRLFRFDGKVNTWIAIEDSVRMNMTNNDTRNTLKTGFINNTNYTYQDQKASDYITLSAGTTVISTTISYIDHFTVPYLVLKLGVILVDYDLTKFPDIISSYSYTRPTEILNGAVSNPYDAIRITLPIVNDIQQAIPYDGQWAVFLYNSREEQRQSLSKVLKPKADL